MEMKKVTGPRFVLFIIAAAAVVVVATGQLSDDVHRTVDPALTDDESPGAANSSSPSSSSYFTATSSGPEAVVDVNPVDDVAGTSFHLNDSTSDDGQDSKHYQSDNSVTAVDADYPVEDASSQVWSKIRHLHQKVRLKDDEGEGQKGQEMASVKSRYEDEPTKSQSTGKTQGQGRTKPPPQANKANNDKDTVATVTTSKPLYRLPASGPRKSQLLAAAAAAASSSSSASGEKEKEKDKGFLYLNGLDPKAERMGSSLSSNVKYPTTATSTAVPPPPMSSGAPRLENKLLAMNGGGFNNGGMTSDGDGYGDEESSTDIYDPSDEETSDAGNDDPVAYEELSKPNLDIVTKFLRIVESQHFLGDNCTAGTDFNLGEGVVDRYAQERFRLEAEVAVDRANWLTRLWKYADKKVLDSEYLLHVNLYSMIEMDEDIFAAGNCYDKWVDRS